MIPRRFPASVVCGHKGDPFAFALIALTLAGINSNTKSFYSCQGTVGRWQNIVLFLVESFSRSITSNATKCWVVNCRKLFGSPGNSRSAQKKKNSDQLKTRHLEKSPQLPVERCVSSQQKQSAVMAVQHPDEISAVFKDPKNFPKTDLVEFSRRENLGRNPIGWGRGSLTHVMIQKYKYTYINTNTQIHTRKDKHKCTNLGLNPIEWESDSLTHDKF